VEGSTELKRLEDFGSVSLKIKWLK
jgi:hypothetical protein